MRLAASMCTRCVLRHAKDIVCTSFDYGACKGARRVFASRISLTAYARANSNLANMGLVQLCAAVSQLCRTVQLDLKRLAEGNLVLATAEQWDRLSRRWRQRRAVSDLSLFISDELHLLGSPDSGPTLEVVVSRMRAVAKLLAKPIRMVGLAASMADAKDVGDWMGVPAHALFNFPPGARATPLEIHIQSLDIASFEARQQVRVRQNFCRTLHVCKHASGCCRMFRWLSPYHLQLQYQAITRGALYSVSIACG